MLPSYIAWCGIQGLRSLAFGVGVTLSPIFTTSLIWALFVGPDNASSKADPLFPLFHIISDCRFPKRRVTHPGTDPSPNIQTRLIPNQHQRSGPHSIPTDKQSRPANGRSRVNFIAPSADLQNHPGSTAHLQKTKK